MDITPAQYEKMLETLFKLQAAYAGKMLIAAKCSAALQTCHLRTSVRFRFPSKATRVGRVRVGSTIVALHLKVN